MLPPLKLHPLFDRHGGFTIETKGRRSGVDTLWRPGSVLGAIPRTACLLTYDERSFYQANNNVTRAVYRVSGYRYPLIAWFDNVTGERIA